MTSDEIYNTALILWIGLVVGAAIGMYIEKKAMRNILRIKSRDGTAEHIGNGQFIYVLSDDDYCKFILGIEKDGPHD